MGAISPPPQPQWDIIHTCLCTNQFVTSTSPSPPPPSLGYPWPFELLKLGRFKFPPCRTKKLFKCPPPPPQTKNPYPILDLFPDLLMLMALHKVVVLHAVPTLKCHLPGNFLRLNSSSN